MSSHNPQVADETLPNSTERAVIIGGNRDAVTACIDSVLAVLLEFPPKGPTVPYAPSTSCDVLPRL